MNSKLLEGRVALVTGASRGIGAAVARGFGRHGASVAVNYRSDAAAAGSVARDIEDNGSRALAVAGDAGDEAEVEAMVRRISEEWGDVDALVCSAVGDTDGIVERHKRGISVLDAGEVIQDRVRTQLDCTLRTCRQVVPGMRRRGGGTVVLISGTGGRKSPTRGIAEIIVAKAAQDALGRLLATELAPEGIRVNTLAPGLVPTDANAGPDQAAMIEAVTAQSPLGRVTDPDDVAEAAVALSSGLTSRTTGAYFPVDGGLTML